MKRILILFIIVLLVLLSGCTSNQSFREGITCEDIMNAIIDVTDHPEADKIYLKSQDNFDAFALSLWADGMYQECDDIALIDDYAIFVSAGTTTYEIAVLKTDTINSTDKLEALMSHRKQTLELGDKGMYDPKFDLRMSTSKTLTVGNFVLFIITDDNDAALNAIEALQ